MLEKFSASHDDKSAAAYETFMSVLDEGGPSYSVGATAVSMIAMFKVLIGADQAIALELFQILTEILRENRHPTTHTSAEVH